MRFGIHEGRSVKPDLKIGICGEHGGDPATIDFCYRAGLSYVSCSPFRVPLARLAGAQAVIHNSGKNIKGGESAEPGKPAAARVSGSKKKPAKGDKRMAVLTAKKPAAKKPAAKKPAVKKTAVKKTAAKKPAAKKPAAKKPAAKKTTVKKTTTTRKTTVKKTAAKKPAAKKPVGRKPAAAKKPAAKKTVGRKPAVKKPAAK